MPFIPSRRRALGAAVAAAAAASCAVALSTASGQAPGGTTMVVTPVGEPSIAYADAAPKGFRRGRFSLGDQVFLAGRVVRDGTVKGTSELVATVSDRRPVAADRAHGFLSGTYHLADGDLYFQGTGLFDEAGTGRGAIVGGTGAYAGARGTIESTDERDVIHLLAG
jgi:hypothetical protein